MFLGVQKFRYFMVSKAVAIYLKVVRRKLVASAEGTRIAVPKRGATHPLIMGFGRLCARL